LQIRIRKKGYFKVFRKLPGAAFTSFRSALVLGTIFSLSSCALFSRGQNSLVDLKKVCLSAEGRGRLEHSKGRHLFEFESLLEKSSHKWSLGLDLPVIGQEVLFFNYPELGQSETKVSGTFATRLKMDIKSRSKKKELSQFFLMMGELLSIIHTGKLRNHWIWNQEAEKLTLERKLKSGEIFHFKAFDAEKHFKKLQLLLEKKNKFGKSKRVVKMSLFISQCSGS
jgi:hypothetical protein